MERKPAIIAYDISDDRTRRAALRIVREWRLDGQYSVHECLLSASEATELFVQLAGALDPETDRLLLAWLHTRRPMLARGKGRTQATAGGLRHVR